MLPSQQSDVFADRDLVVLARYTGSGMARVVVEGVRRGAPVRWTSTVVFPDRERANPFVARLWATQRVGYLSAEQRKHGSNPELDEEIRMLGERYGIPTAFTSYLVLEPGLDRSQLDMARRAGAPMPASAAKGVISRDASFEAAKAASEQRKMTNAAALDSLALAAPPPAPAQGSARANTPAETRRVDGRTFTLTNGVWTDARYRQGMDTLVVKPFSPAYFDLMADLPDLRAPFALGERVIVAGRTRAIVLSDAGVSQVSAALRAALVNGW
jgi:Ca-activated chloride channel family protein